MKVDKAIFNVQVRYLQVFMLLPVSVRNWYYLNQLGWHLLLYFFATISEVSGKPAGLLGNNDSHWAGTARNEVRLSFPFTSLQIVIASEGQGFE